MERNGAWRSGSGLRTGLLAALLTLAPVLGAPDASVRERAARDAARLTPQLGLGGDAAAKLSPMAFDVVEIPIGLPGYENSAHLSVPKDLPEGRRYPLLLLVHGNGWVAKEAVARFAAISTERDPIFCLALQFQLLKEDGKGWTDGPWLGTLEMLDASNRWLVETVLKDHPIDPDRVFLGAFGWGSRWACDWAATLSKEKGDAFPFRAMLLLSAAGFFGRESIPPVPMVLVAGEKTTEVKALGGVNVLEQARRYANTLLSWGHPCQYHQLPEAGHEVTDRMLQIVRDTVNELGGPGATHYETKAEAAFPREPIPLEARGDPFLEEELELLRADRFREARVRAAELIEKGSLEAKRLRAIRKFAADLDRFARKELTRLDREVAKSVREGEQISPHSLRRMDALIDAYSDQGWVTTPGYAEKLSKMREEYPPLVREREREEMMRKAWAMEADPESRGAAERLYEDLVLRTREDGGTSVWPEAAAYRLSWWIEIE